MSNTRITLIFEVFKVMGLWGGGGGSCMHHEGAKTNAVLHSLACKFSHLTVTTRKYDFAKQRA